MKQVRAFLGTAGWLREFIPRFSEKAAPLTDLTQGKGKFKWTIEAQEAFEKLKDEASKPLMLARPNPDGLFILQTDASKLGMAAVLFQEDDEGKRQISHASAKFKGAELRYHANEAECYAAVWAMKRYKHFSENKQFVLRTDSNSLTWLDRFTDTKAKFLRWAILLQEFNFTIEHVAGVNNQLPDFLSRNPDDAPDAEEDVDANVELMTVPKISVQTNTHHNSHPERMKQMQFNKCI